MSRRSDMTQLSERRPDARRSTAPRPPARGVAQISQVPARGAPAASRPGGATPGDVTQGLRDSLASTDEGLRRFLEMLRRSGLAEAVHGYRAMQMVLVQQRLWTHSQGRTELLPLFQSLARTADELHRIFAGFAAVMLPLKEIDKLTAMSVLEPPPEANRSGPVTPEATSDESPSVSDAPPPGRGGCAVHSEPKGARTP